MIPLCHLAQEQDGWLTEEAMAHIGELVGHTPAEILGTASFYEMLKRHPVGTYVVNVCTSISCFLMGGDELLEHAEESLGIKAGNTTKDGLFSLEGYECIAACTERRASKSTTATSTRSTTTSSTGSSPTCGPARGDIPPHGTLATIRQRIPADRAAGNVAPDRNDKPVWIRTEG